MTPPKYNTLDHRTKQFHRVPMTNVSERDSLTTVEFYDHFKNDRPGRGLSCRDVTEGVGKPERDWKGLFPPRLLSIRFGMFRETGGIQRPQEYCYSTPPTLVPRSETVK